MAKYNLDKYTAADGLGFPLNFRRGNPNPLDNSSVWASLEAAQNYASTDPVAYVGQILTVVDNIGGTATVYSIQDEAGTLKKVGTSPVGDEATITVAEDGTISLFGVEGLELTRTEDDGSITKINYQPLLVDGKLTWVEPSSTTVEGLALEIEGLKTRVSNVETTLGNAESGLVKAVADNTAAISGINTTIGTVEEGKTLVEMISEAAYDDTALANRVGVAEGKLTTLIGSDANKSVRTIANEELVKQLIPEGAKESLDTLQEIAAWIQAHPDDASAMSASITKLQDIVAGIGGDGEQATVIDYVTSVTTPISEKVSTIEGKVSALEAVGAERNVIASVDTAQFSIDSERKLSLLDIAMGKVTGLTEALANKVDKVEGSRLITADEATKLNALVLAENNEVSFNGTISSDKVDGLSGLLAGKVNVEEGKGLSSNDFTNELLAKLNGIEAGAQVNDIEIVKIAGNALAISEKAVNIPVATAEAFGVVLSSAAENKVAVAADGTMEVNSVNVNKLVQTPAEYLILNGGSSDD